MRICFWLSFFLTILGSSDIHTSFHRNWISSFVSPRRRKKRNLNASDIDVMSERIVRMFSSESVRIMYEWSLEKEQNPKCQRICFSDRFRFVFFLVVFSKCFCGMMDEGLNVFMLNLSYEIQPLGTASRLKAVSSPCQASRASILDQHVRVWCVRMCQDSSIVNHIQFSQTPSHDERFSREAVQTFIHHSYTHPQNNVDKTTKSWHFIQTFIHYSDKFSTTF